MGRAPRSWFCFFWCHGGGKAVARLVWRPLHTLRGPCWLGLALCQSPYTWPFHGRCSLPAWWPIPRVGDQGAERAGQPAHLPVLQGRKSHALFERETLRTVGLGPAACGWVTHKHSSQHRAPSSLRQSPSYCPLSTQQEASPLRFPRPPNLNSWGPPFPS